MLTEERHQMILNALDGKNAVTLSELCSLLGASASTVRRDLNHLAERGLLIKIHGGAMPCIDKFSFGEQNIEEKSHLYNDEKTAIAKYAASLIEIVIKAFVVTYRIRQCRWARNLVGTDKRI